MMSHLSPEEPLKNRLQQLLDSENIDAQRLLVSSLAQDLNIDHLSCAAALVYLLQGHENILPNTPTPAKSTPLGIKMVRYRLDVGSKHRITLEQLKRVLVDESGVDKNNITNINIQSQYTLIELPDEMPPDIFQHLKLVEINQQKLDIRRVKPRNAKKRSSNHNRRGRKRDTPNANRNLPPNGIKPID